MSLTGHPRKEPKSAYVLARTSQPISTSSFFDTFQLTVGTSAKTPVHIPLQELEVEEAIVYTTTVFADIAFQARDRRCKLHPTSLPTISTSVLRQSSVPPAPSGREKRKAKESTESDTPAIQVSPARKAKYRTAVHDSDGEAQVKIQKLEAELAQTRRELAHKPPSTNSYTTSGGSKQSAAKSSR